MDQAIGFETNEMTKVIASVAVEFYAQTTPAAVAGRLARLHQAAWDEVLAGRQAGRRSPNCAATRNVCSIPSN